MIQDLNNIDPEQSQSAAVTLQDIARKLNVSAMTVSLALRDKPPISLARRQQIQQIAREMGYQPNTSAQTLARRPRSRNPKISPIQQTSRTIKTIAWINNWKNPRNLFTNKKYNLYWKGASAAAHHFGAHLQEIIVPHQAAFSELEKTLRNQQIRTLLIPPHESDCVLDWNQFSWNGFSVIKIDHSLPQIPGNTVADNEFANSQLALQEISKRGYSRIGFVSQEKVGLFEAGFLASQLPQAQIPVLRLLEDDPEKNLNDLFLWIQEYRPDAILSNVPDIKRMLLLLGQRIPEDIGLAVAHERVDHSLSGVFPRSEEIGWVAVETLVHSLTNKHSSNVTMQIAIPGQWINGSTLPDKTFQGSPPRLQDAKALTTPARNATHSVVDGETQLV